MADASSRTRGYLTNTVKHGGIYALGTILSRLAGFIMLPVYTRLLSTTDYGILEILGLTADIFSMLAGLGIGTALIRFYHRYETEDERRRVVSSAMLLSLFVFGAVALTGLAYAESISRLLLGPEQPVRYVRLAVIGLALGTLVDIPLVFLQARLQSTAVVGANIARLLLALSLNILFVVYLRLGVAGVFYSTILSSLIVGGYLSLRVLWETGLRFNAGIARALVVFGAPLMAGQLGSFVLHFSDRFFLRFYESLTEVGLYALGYKFAMLIATLVVGPFSSIFLPKMYEIDRREREGAPPILSAILGHYGLLLVSAALVVAIFSRDAISIVAGPAFQEAARPVPLLALAMVMFGYRLMSQAGAMITGRTGAVAVSTTAAASVVIALNFLLIPHWGMMGAAAATLGAFATEFFIMRHTSQKLYPMRVELRALLLPVGVACGAWFVGDAASTGAPPLVGFAIRLAAFGAYVGILVLLGVVTRGHLQLVGRIVCDPRGTLAALRVS